MNYATFLIKIVSEPEQNFCNNDISYTQFQAKFYQYKNNQNTFCKISVWGNLSYDIVRYYQLNDYVIVEGYTVLQNSNLQDINIKTIIEIVACKIYPFALTKKK